MVMEEGVYRNGMCVKRKRLLEVVWTLAGPAQ